ncbi:MAG: FGGY-family carbohydrate kinase [Alkalispirochaetaceae bacterium]
MGSYAIAVFDVGKTNKKLLIYSEELELLDSVYRSFPVRVEGGVEVEPIDEVELWLVENLRRFAGAYAIRVVSVTTHGASFVGVDAAGEQSMPMLSYTHEPGDAFHEEFYNLVGERGELQRRTATMDLGALINPAKGIYFCRKHYPEAFERTAHILFFPQYWGFRMTGEVAADYTYAGCHTYLWDFEGWDWSHVADTLGIREKLPQRIGRSWDLLGTITEDFAEKSGLHPDTVVTLGIHDSNSSLLPYLIKKKDEDFVLNSTGTWCVAMHPTDTVAFAEDEIGKSVFFNISAFGTPVKTTLLAGGLEFETYTEILKSIDGTPQLPDYNRPLYKRLIEERGHFVLPSVLAGTGQFPSSKPRVVENGAVYHLEEIREGRRIPEFFNDFPAAFAAVNLSLAIQTEISLKRVGLTDGVSIYTEGGFRNNPDYNALLTAFFENSPVYLTGMEEATSFGAALLAKSAQEETPVEGLGELFEIETQEVRRESFEHLREYVAAFMEEL